MKSNNNDRSDENDADGKSCLWGCLKELIQTNKYYIKKYIHGHNVKYIKRSYPKRKTHPNWKGGRIKQGNYWYNYKPDHPFTIYYCPYIAEHGLVFEHYLKILLLRTIFQIE